MEDLIIKIKVKDPIEAYRAVSRLSYTFRVLEAKYKTKVWKFDKEDKSKEPKMFLNDNFGKKQ